MKSESFSPPLLELRQLAKSFGGNSVFRDISISVKRGEVLVLLGENGAGKSTLKNVLCGLVPHDSGDIVFDGTVQGEWNSQIAAEKGIGAIHQELSLFPNLSVFENIFLREMAQRPLRAINRKKLQARAENLFLEVLGIEFDCSQVVSNLSLGQRQLVEILKAVHSSSSLLVLDEPTTSLSMKERGLLFSAIGRLREEGYAVIHVTHFLDEVKQIGDRVVVLRDGELVADLPAEGTSRNQIELFMVGREIEKKSRNRVAQTESDSPVLSVENISDGMLLEQVSFSLHQGEILGLAGLTGAGRTELMQAIFGLRKSTGEIRLRGKPYRSPSVSKSKRLGISLVSEDRRNEQAFLDRPLFENLSAAFLRPFLWAGVFLQAKREKGAAFNALRDFAVKFDNLAAPISSLSGGNQQKIILARWILGEPQVLLLDEPTKGIDIGARAYVHERISALAENGVSVLLASSDTPELIELCDRILVMRQGRITAEIDRKDFDASEILRHSSHEVTFSVVENGTT